MSVDEGIKYNFGNILVTNDLKKMNTNLILQSLPISTGDEYNASKIKESVEGIKDLAELQGYSFIEINPKLKKEDNNIDIDIIINEGPRVYVNEISISGNTRTIDKVIRREISLSKEMRIINIQLIIQKTH